MAASLLAGCSSPGTDSGNDDDSGSILIGGVWPMSGEAATVGEASAAGAEIAADKVAADGGPTFEFKFEDSQLDTQLGVTALESVIADGARAVLTGGSGVIVAQGPVIDREELPVLNNMAQSPLLEDVSDWLFNIIPTSTEELRQVAEIGVTDLGLKTFATLVVDSDLGKGDVDVLSGFIEELGGEIVANETFPVGASDMRTALTRIRDINPDGLYLVGNTDELGNLIAQAGELGIESQLLGRTQTLDPAVLQRAGAAADGMVGSATVFRPSEENVLAQEFIDAYRDHTGNEPTVFAAVAYDAVALLGAAFQELGNDASSQEIADWLNSQTDFPGVMGAIKIENGTAAYPLFQFEIENGAPEPFAG